MQDPEGVQLEGANARQLCGQFIFPFIIILIVLLQCQPLNPPPPSQPNPPPLPTQSSQTVPSRVSSNRNPSSPRTRNPSPPSLGLPRRKHSSISNSTMRKQSRS
ncbi:hypothetical protein FGO68_gene7103 [Halteria grandinella]|uniref:Uncharacterized protein n=1 Tax=Halteria grandinella TaxID=5974 RepID=A0A8J8P1X8_HALGN|nr:hypothetical protein FGO68_gene7103 [Halteria grandinella]